MSVEKYQLSGMGEQLGILIDKNSTQVCKNGMR